MLPRENHRTLGQIFDDIGPSLRSNGPLQWSADARLPDGPGRRAGRDRRRLGRPPPPRRHGPPGRVGADRARLGAAARAVAVSALLRGGDRAALGLRRARRGGRLGRARGRLVDAPQLRGIAVRRRRAARGARPRAALRGRRCSPIPCARRIRAPTSWASCAAISAQTWVDPVAEEIERRGGPYPVRDRRHARLHAGASTCASTARRSARSAASTSSRPCRPPWRPASRRRAGRRGARYLISDGAHSAAPPRAGLSPHLQQGRAPTAGSSRASTSAAPLSADGSRSPARLPTGRESASERSGAAARAGDERPLEARAARAPASASSAADSGS